MTSMFIKYVLYVVCCMLYVVCCMLYVVSYFDDNTMLSYAQHVDEKLFVH